MGVNVQSLEAVPFRITDPERIPSARYYDETFYRLECEHLWSRVWQMACRLEEIPEVGDWVEYKILDKSVIVVRAKSGVKAFHNACRHRGVQLASGHGSCEVQGFTCPFHGWRWNIEGQNTFVYARHLFSEDMLKAAEINLVPCRVELWGGSAFINFDDAAPPLADCVKPLAERLDPRNVDKLKVEWWTSTVLPVNWKLAMEAFMEGYHVMRTHPQLHEAGLPGFDMYAGSAPGAPTPSMGKMTSREVAEMAISYNNILSEGMAGMVHANDVAVAHRLKETVQLPEDPQAGFMEFMRLWNDAVTQDGKARGAPMPDLNAIGPVSPVQFIFPHYFLLPMFGNMSSYRIRPLGPESCLFEIWSLVLFPEDEVRARPVAPEPIPYDDPRFPAIPNQDYSNLPLQQLGLHAKGFEFMRLSKAVEGMISNYQRTIDGFLGGLPNEKLVPAIQAASADFDAPIKEIGF
jgi:phenylpropionate dioxygenase-like ring-hydroxylating dioxygenase large terminal subunit